MDFVLYMGIFGGRLSEHLLDFAICQLCLALNYFWWYSVKLRLYCFFLATFYSSRLELYSTLSYDTVDTLRSDFLSSKPALVLDFSNKPLLFHCCVFLFVLHQAILLPKNFRASG